MADLSYRRALAYEGLESWEECRDAADATLENRPTDLGAFLMKAKAETKLNLHRDALATYGDIIRRWNSHPGAHILRAEILLCALPFFVLVPPPVIWIFSRSSFLFLALGRPDDAAASANNGIGYAADFYKPDGSRAEVEGSMEAIGMEALSVLPEPQLRAELADAQRLYHADGFRVLSRANAQQKKLKAALESINESLKYDPDSTQSKDLKMKIQDEIIATAS